MKGKPEPVKLKTLTIRNVPVDLHRALKRCALEHDQTLQDVILEALQRATAKG